MHAVPIVLRHATEYVRWVAQHVVPIVYLLVLEDVVRNAMDALHHVLDSVEMVVVTDAWDNALDVVNLVLLNVADVLEIVVHHVRYTAV